MPSLASFALIAFAAEGPPDRSAGLTFCFEEEASAPEARVETFPTSSLDSRSIRKNDNRVRLYQGTARKRCDADDCARRIRLLEVTSHGLVDAGEVRQVRQIHRELHDVAQRRAGRLGDRFEIPEDSLDLIFDPFHQLAACRIEADLPGQIQRVA